MHDAKLELFCAKRMDAERKFQARTLTALWNPPMICFTWAAEPGSATSTIDFYEGTASLMYFM
jgi:hypothetical protein